MGAVADQRNAGRGGVELQNRLVQAVRPAQQIDRRTSRPTATSRGDEDQEESEGIDLTRGEERLTSTVDGRRGEEEKKGRGKRTNFVRPGFSVRGDATATRAKKCRRRLGSSAREGNGRKWG